MSKVKFTKEMELSTSKSVIVHIEVEGLLEPRYGADIDGNGGIGKWFVDGHTYEIESEDELTNDEMEEVNDMVEDLVYDGDFDFQDNANYEKEEDDL